MAGLYFETPLVNKKYNLYITPKLFGIFDGSQSNSNKISNEDSTDYKYDLNYYDELNNENFSEDKNNINYIGYYEPHPLDNKIIELPFLNSNLSTWGLMLISFISELSSK